MQTMTLPTAAAQRSPDAAASPPTQLSVGDAVCIILGIIIGATIFETPRNIFENVADPMTGMLAWLLGGVIALVGALCYAELASTYRTTGGDYTYLTRAFGRTVGFLFAWAELAVIRTGGSIAYMAYVFAKYANQLADLGPSSTFIYASASIIILTVINGLGMQPGRRAQNILTLTKVIGLLGIVVVGGIACFLPTPPRPAATPPAMSATTTTSFALAMVFVFYAYGGWNEAAFVAGEVKEPKRNIVRALVLGTSAVAIIYLLVNIAYLAALGFDGVRTSSAVAAEVLWTVFGDTGRVVMSLLVMISALGAINGLLFTGVRLYSAFGADHPLFSWLAAKPEEKGGSHGALIAQAGFSLLLIALIEFAAYWTIPFRRISLFFGLTPFQGFHRGSASFDDLVSCTAPVFWLFFLMTGLSIFVLRQREKRIERPFRVPLYPWLPLIFVGSCAFMLFRSVDYALSQEPAEALVVFLLVLAGIPLCVWSESRRVAEPVPKRPRKKKRARR